MLGARADRGEHLLGRRGGEHEHDVRRRLFECLQQRVRRAGAQHVHFVDQVHLVRRRGAETEVHALGEVAHRLDTVVRRGVELEQIQEAAVGDTDAVVAHAARVAVGTSVRAVECFGEEARHRGLARATRTGEQVGVTDALVAHRVAHGGGDMGLPDHFGEALRAVLPVEGLVGHRRSSSPSRSGHGSPVATVASDLPVTVGGSASILDAPEPLEREVPPPCSNDSLARCTDAAVASSWPGSSL